MATKKSTRIGIWIIAAMMLVGTLGSFAAMILQPMNTQTDQARIKEMTEQYQAAYAAYQEKLDAQAVELSKQYYDEFSKYSDHPEAFDASEVDELQTTDLKNGTGEEITAETEYKAYYIGWNPKGKVFDSSIQGDSLKAPIAGGNLIPGWNKGVIGMKVGGVRQLTIPAELAYGEAGQGEDIPPNTPLKFIVMVIQPPQVADEPTVPQELIDYYANQ
ncbi:MAG TPA: FKBP-type peptidyl-prolyl cis-trans isomerase [Candidatus Saccharimonadales bacterium]|nr:FKBP-type peptidyl-prolyl cis-trans isomerase [Candidatus Saccharimonadales bacterium]